MEEFETPTFDLDSEDDTRLSSLVLPSRPGMNNTCWWCCAPLLDAVEICENCADHRTTLDSLVPLVPVSLYHRDTPLREWITAYKPDFRDIHASVSLDIQGSARLIRRVLRKFFAANEWLLSNTDAILIVPSTDRVPPHPLESLISQTTAADLLRPQALSRTQVPLGHRAPHSRAFEPTIQLLNQRVLLVDDVYASGARLQSAATAILNAGGLVSAAVVVARRVNPPFDSRIEEHWQRQSTLEFTWNRAQWNREQTLGALPQLG